MVNSSNTEKLERGAAMIEAALLVPFLLFTSLACWDAGRILNALAVLLANTSQFAEWVASDAGLEIGSFQVRYTGAVNPPIPTPPNSDLCPTAIGYQCQACSGVNCAGSCGGADSAITDLCDAVTALESSGLSEIRLGSAIARLNFDTPVAVPDRVEVTLSATFNGVFLFNNQTIQARKLLPYAGPRG